MNRLLLLSFLAGHLAVRAATYQVGDAVENFTLINRATGQPMQLADFAGKILVCDWFAWWCPFCQAAAPQLLSGVHEHYATRGGNSAGIPVVSVGLNLQANQETQTQNFVTRAGYDVVLQDFNRALANRFFTTGGQPLFVIINCVTNSPSHRPWELLYSRAGYGQTTFPVAEFRAAVDAVKAATVVPEPPRLSRPQFVADRLSFSFAARPGWSYRIETSPDLLGWQEAAQVTAATAEQTVELPASGETRFVRVVMP